MFHFKFTSIVFVLTALVAFQARGQETLNETLDFGGLEREYIVHIPSSYSSDSPSPLLLCFHGYTSYANIIMAYSNFNAIADTANFIVVYPQGSLLDGVTHWNVGGWTLNSTVDDVGFVNALLDQLLAEYAINPSRIYSTGMSNGGFMSFTLACEMSNRIAAVASVTGSMTVQTFANCDPLHPTPVIQIHGTADGTVPYEGNALWTESIENVISYWANYNNCDPEAIVTEVPDIDTSDGSTVQHIAYLNGTYCSSVEHYKVIGGDHDWPDFWGNQDINASALVWNFLSQYTLQGQIGCETLSISPSLSEKPSFDVFPNPAHTALQIKQVGLHSANYSIYTMQGALVKTGKIQGTTQRIDISSLESNVYFLRIGASTQRILVLK